MRKCIYFNTLESTFATRPHRDVYVKCRWFHLSLSFTFALSLKVTLLYNHFRRNTAPRPFDKFKHNVFKCTPKCRQFGMLKFKVSKRFASNDIFVWFSSLVGACFCVMHVEQYFQICAFKPQPTTACCSLCGHWTVPSDKNNHFNNENI